MKNVKLILGLILIFTSGITWSQISMLHENLPGNNAGSEYLVDLPADPDDYKAELNAGQVRDWNLNLVACPNPFTIRTVISCTLPTRGKLLMDIRNMFGQSVRTIETNIEDKGDRATEVTSEKLRPGIYSVLVVFKTDNIVISKTIRIVFTQ